MARHSPAAPAPGKQVRARLSRDCDSLPRGEEGFPPSCALHPPSRVSRCLGHPVKRCRRARTRTAVYTASRHARFPPVGEPKLSTACIVNPARPFPKSCAMPLPACEQTYHPLFLRLASPPDVQQSQHFSALIPPCSSRLNEKNRFEQILQCNGAASHIWPAPFRVQQPSFP